MLKDFSNASNNKLISLVVLTSKLNPIIKKIKSVIINDGIVVYIIYLICVKRSVPATAAARFVVSDSGDILSPK